MSLWKTIVIEHIFGLTSRNRQMCVVLIMKDVSYFHGKYTGKYILILLVPKVAKNYPLEVYLEPP